VSVPDAEGGETIIAPIPGLITALKVEVGDWVDAGRTVVVIEAMKMENNLVTHCAGIVKTIHVQKGSQVNTGDPILTIG